MSYLNKQEPFSVEHSPLRQELVILTQRKAKTQIIGEGDPFQAHLEHKDTLLPSDEEVYRQVAAAVSRIVNVRYHGTIPDGELFRNEEERSE